MWVNITQDLFIYHPNETTFNSPVVNFCKITVIVVAVALGLCPRVCHQRASGRTGDHGYKTQYGEYKYSVTMEKGGGREREGERRGGGGGNYWSDCVMYCQRGGRWMVMLGWSRVTRQGPDDGELQLGNNGSVSRVSRHATPGITARPGRGRRPSGPLSAQSICTDKTMPFTDKSWFHVPPLPTIIPAICCLPSSHSVICSNGGHGEIIQRKARMGVMPRGLSWWLLFFLYLIRIKMEVNLDGTRRSGTYKYDLSHSLRSKINQKKSKLVFAGVLN